MKKVLVALTAAIAAGVLGMTASAERMTEAPVTFSGIDENGQVTSLVMDGFSIDSVVGLKGEGAVPMYLNRINFDFKTNSVGALPELVMTCFDQNGMPLSTLDFDHTKGYIDVPDLTAMVEISAKTPDTESDSYFYCEYMNVYSYDGRASGIHELLLPVYESVGWYAPVTVYDNDKNAVTISPFLVKEYEGMGYFEHVTMYNKEGQSLVVSKKDVDAKKTEGWECAVSMYDANENWISVIPSEVETYLQNGWNKAVTLYALSGETIEVTQKDVAAYEQVGWYTYENYTYITVIQPQYANNKASGKYHANLKLVETWLPTFSGTVHEASLYAIKTETIQLWHMKANAPLAYTGKNFDKENARVYIGVTNVSFSKIVSFKIRFDIFDAAGEKTGYDYEYYYSTKANMEPGELATFKWKNEAMVNPVSVDNFKVLEVVFEDGTTWYGDESR